MFFNPRSSSCCSRQATHRRPLPLRTNDVVVVLDTEVTAELEAEGLARDLIRHVQQARKDAGFEVTDRIAVEVRWSPDQLAQIRAHDTTIAAAVLAERIEWLPGGAAPELSLTKVS